MIPRQAETKRDCEGCHGNGVRFPAGPSCSIPGWRRPWAVVERCDSCEQYGDDLDAAHSMFRSVFL